VKRYLAFGLTILALLIAAIPAGGVSAQDTAQVRIVQYFYRSMDLFVDGQPAIQALYFEYDTDYLPLAAGKHSLAVVSAGEEIDTGITGDVEFADGHHYSVVVYGNWDSDEQPALLVLDETELFAGMDPANNRVLFLDLVSGAPAVDGYVNDTLIKEGLSYGQVAPFEVEPGPFTTKITLSGKPEMVLQTLDSFYGIPQAVTLAALVGTSPFSSFVSYLTTTELNMADYLAFEAQTDGSYEQVVALIETAGLTDELAGEGPITFFAPPDYAIEALPQAARDALAADPPALAEVVHYHMVADYLPPYLLEGQTALTSLQGTVLTLDFPSDDWPRVNGASIYPGIRVGNGYVYPIDGVLDPVSGHFQSEEVPLATS
jgi:uncharacterized surface protein with fasciclin (FAS1) repeats